MLLHRQENQQTGLLCQGLLISIHVLRENTHVGRRLLSPTFLPLVGSVGVKDTFYCRVDWRHRTPTDDCLERANPPVSLCCRVDWRQTTALHTKSLLANPPVSLQRETI